MRTARKLTAVAASAALIGAGSLLAATPAHANTTVAASCADGSSATLEIDPVPSTKLTVTGLSDCVGIYINKQTVDDQNNDVTFVGGSATLGPSIFGTWDYSPITWGTGSLEVDLAATVPTTPGFTLLSGNNGKTGSPRGFFEVKVRSASPSPSPSPSNSTASGSSPAPVIQQFGKPASGTCEEAAPADLNLAGVDSGGWGESWAQWMNGGTGGAVCTRTLSYVGSGWTVS